ncbi:MAG TPA: YbaB/EbfC family nucleoid-associated protein [Acidimicrobiales bacterium]|nr:YbaB/EbfC family nucleoid-associated protein [Acidimicrobiales bacterium]
MTPPPDDDRELLPEGLEAASVEGADNPFGTVDLASLLDQAQRLQEQLISAQAAAADTVVEGRAGGGQVVITMSGEGEPLSVHIDPAVVDPAEPDVLEDLVLAAMRDAVEQARELSQEALGGLGGLLGGGSPE